MLKKFLKVTLPVVVIITVMLAVPSLAFGQTPDTSSGNTAISSYLVAADSNQNTDITINGSWGDKKVIKLRGQGTLDAEGKGAIRIKGRTDKSDEGIITISGNGVLIIRDLQGDIDKKVTGYGGVVQLKDNTWIYYGFKGDAEIKGGGFIINYFGENLTLHAKGRGLVFLAGEGTYTIEGNSETNDNQT
ncbi:MAG: hypothetical protein M1308_04230 [Actinobacteria bacterium]|nr:hypothetical protein [Actinomycetota bacterium]